MQGTLFPTDLPTGPQTRDAKPAEAPAYQHTCHWPGCGVAVPPKMWGCKRHWFTLPKPLRDAIWDAYVPGQEITKTPSAEYMDAAHRVQEWIREFEANRPGAAPALAAKADPQTSHDAAAYYVSGGGYATDCGRVYRALQAHDGATSAELAQASGIDRHLCAKRLPNLEAAGVVRRGESRPCKTNGNKAVTWWVGRAV